MILAAGREITTKFHRPFYKHNRVQFGWDGSARKCFSLTKNVKHNSSCTPCKEFKLKYTTVEAENSTKMNFKTNG